eukprot:gnl/TRDRNA2_/TRDRNA2_130580_c1_seq1.p1 gnl/TRDRNA2_/TRDRNA2_130580_c1~~gnl/TRDRNA2_/TRDRNA2_130580_c1_seq1.p1  ORF type:complete len:507 (-),score=56.74 gnl/TRDRNA2_/TRDRNA2_130580_c1_seq1:67-1587(-)
MKEVVRECRDVDISRQHMFKRYVSKVWALGLVSVCTVLVSIRTARWVPDEIVCISKCTGTARQLGQPKMSWTNPIRSLRCGWKPAGTLVLSTTAKARTRGRKPEVAITKVTSSTAAPVTPVEVKKSQASRARGRRAAKAASPTRQVLPDKIQLRAPRRKTTGVGVATATAIEPESATRKTSASASIVMSLSELVPATVIRRPSSRNKSPYVGDVRLDDGREAIAHMPSLDMGGKCIAGTQVLLKPAVDKKGQPLGANVLGKYGTPKCEFILQLIHCREPENAHLGGCWVSAHPSHGEKIADELLRRGCFETELGGHIRHLAREVTGVAGTDMRCDFLATLTDGRRWVIEIKTVVDTDYHPKTVPQRKGCVFVGPEPYERAGIFPWGRAAQTGPDGEKVVSARAIKHVDELSALAAGQRMDEEGRLHAALIFVVVRNDVLSFRPNVDACASFARHLHSAHTAGVHLSARRIRWECNGTAAVAIDEGPLALNIQHDEQIAPDGKSSLT